MTSLWFRHLRPQDRVSVKPHASPVLHAINYLLGELDESYLTTLRAFGGLQSYPSRIKDPDPVDYSTGLGRHRRDRADLGRGGPPVPRTAGSPPARAGPRPAVLAARRRGAGRGRRLGGDRRPGRGRARRGRLDRRPQPPVAGPRGARSSAAAGCRACSPRRAGRCITRQVRAAARGAVRPAGRRGAARPDRRHAESGVPAAAPLRPGRAADRLPAGRRTRRWPPWWPAWTTRSCARAIRNLGGHDLGSLDEAFAAIDDTRPTVIFAYTIKGYGLPIEGHPQNHSALLTEAQLGELAARLGADPDQPWRRFAPAAPEAELCAEPPGGCAARSRPRRCRRPCRPDLGRTPTGDRHHPGRARPGPARPDPGGAARRPPGSSR